MPWYVLSIFAILSALSSAHGASFGAVWVHRLSPRLFPFEGAALRRLAERNTCDQCGIVLPWLNTRPIIGWLLTKGQCPCKKERVPGFYLVSEAAAGLCGFLFCLLWLEEERYLLSLSFWTIWSLIIWPCLASAAIVAMALDDWRSETVHDGMALTVGILGVLAPWHWHGSTPDVLDSVIGAAIAGLGIMVSLGMGLLIRLWRVGELALPSEVSEHDHRRAGLAGLSAIRGIFPWGDVTAGMALGAYAGVASLWILFLGIVVGLAAGFIVTEKGRRALVTHGFMPFVPGMTLAIPFMLAWWTVLWRPEPFF